MHCWRKDDLEFACRILFNFIKWLKSLLPKHTLKFGNRKMSHRDISGGYGTCWMVFTSCWVELYRKIRARCNGALAWWKKNLCFQMRKQYSVLSGDIVHYYICENEVISNIFIRYSVSIRWIQLPNEWYSILQLLKRYRVLFDLITITGNHSLLWNDKIHSILAGIKDLSSIIYSFGLLQLSSQYLTR